MGCMYAGQISRWPGAGAGMVACTVGACHAPCPYLWWFIVPWTVTTRVRCGAWLGGRGVDGSLIYAWYGPRTRGLRAGRRGRGGRAVGSSPPVSHASQGASWRAEELPGGCHGTAQGASPADLMVWGRGMGHNPALDRRAAPERRRKTPR